MMNNELYYIMKINSFGFYFLFEHKNKLNLIYS